MPIYRMSETKKKGSGRGRIGSRGHGTEVFHIGPSKKDDGRIAFRMSASSALSKSSRLKPGDYCDLEVNTDTMEATLIHVDNPQMGSKLTSVSKSPEEYRSWCIKIDPRPGLPIVPQGQDVEFKVNHRGITFKLPENTNFYDIDPEPLKLFKM